MVSFFGLGKKKKAEPPKPAPAPTPTQWKKVDQNALGEGQFFGNNGNAMSKPPLNPSMREFPSRPGTSSSMRNSPYTMQTHNFAAASMRDLSNMPSSSWAIEAPGTGLKSSASDANLGMRWANSSSTSLAAPAMSTGLRPGTPTGRPTTSAGDRKKPWVNPLDVHFNRAAVPAAPKSPLGNFELQVDVDGTGSLFGDDDIESTTSKAGAAAALSPLTTTFSPAVTSGLGSPLSPLGPPSSPPTTSLPSPPRSVNGAGDKFEKSRNLRPQHKGFGPTSLPSPALSQRGGSQDSGPIKNTDKDSEDSTDSDSHDNNESHPLDEYSDPWDEADALDFDKPVIRDVAAKRDTLTISGPRRQSLSMKIEELEKSLVSAQQESEQKNKAAAAAIGLLPLGDGGRLRSASSATPQLRTNAINWQTAVWVGNGAAGPAGNSSPANPEDRKPSPSFADNRGPRSQSPMRQFHSPNAGPAQGGFSGAPGGRGMPLRDQDGRSQLHQVRNDQRPLAPFAKHGPSSRSQSPMGRASPGPRAESPMDRYGAESPVDRPPPRPFAKDPPPRSPMRAAVATAGPMSGGSAPVFPKRGNGPNSSNPNGYWGPMDKGLNNYFSSSPEPSPRVESPPAVELSIPQMNAGRVSPMLNGIGPIRGPNTPRRPAPEEYGVIPSNSDRGLGRGPPRAALGAVRGNVSVHPSPQRTPLDDAETIHALHPPPRHQPQQAIIVQEPTWESDSEDSMPRNNFAAPLASPLFPNRNNSFGGGVSAPVTPDISNWPLPASSLNITPLPARPRTAGGPGHDGDNNALGIGMAGSMSPRKAQRPHVPPPLNLYNAQQYAEEIPAGPFTPSSTAQPLTPTRSMTTPMAACDDPRPKTAGAGAGTIGMARGLSLRYERERQGFDPDSGTAWGGQGPRAPRPDMPVFRRPDHGLNAPTGIADRFGNRFI